MFMKPLVIGEMRTIPVSGFDILVTRQFWEILSSQIKNFMPQPGSIYDGYERKTKKIRYRVKLWTSYSSGTLHTRGFIGFNKSYIP